VTNSGLSAVAKSGSSYFGYVGGTVARAVLISPFISSATVVVADAACGIVDLGYIPPLLQWAQQNNVSVSGGPTS
jgi:hypothetical protein